MLIKLRVHDKKRKLEKQYENYNPIQIENT